MPAFLAPGPPVFAKSGSMFALSDAMAGDAVRAFVAAADPFPWADRLHARGVAAKPLVRKRLTARSQEDRIRWALARPALTTSAGDPRSTRRTGRERLPKP